MEARTVVVGLKLRFMVALLTVVNLWHSQSHVLLFCRNDWLSTQNSQNSLTCCCGGVVSCGSGICCCSKDWCWINNCYWGYQAKCNRIREGLWYLVVGGYLPMLLHCPHSDDIWYLLDYGLTMDYLLIKLWSIKLIFELLLILSWYHTSGIKRIDILDY